MAIGSFHLQTISRELLCSIVTMSPHRFDEAYLPLLVVSFDASYCCLSPPSNVVEALETGARFGN